MFELVRLLRKGKTCIQACPEIIVSRSELPKQWELLKEWIAHSPGNRTFFARRTNVGYGLPERELDRIVREIIDTDTIRNALL